MTGLNTTFATDTRSEDADIMRAVRRIVENGNSAEIKGTSEGALKVFEVRRKIAVEREH